MRTDENTQAPAPARDYHVHQCPSDGMVFPCTVRHREDSIFLDRQIVAMHRAAGQPHRRTW